MKRYYYCLYKGSDKTDKLFVIKGNYLFKRRGVRKLLATMYKVFSTIMDISEKDFYKITWDVSITEEPIGGLEPDDYTLDDGTKLQFAILSAVEE